MNTFKNNAEASYYSVPSGQFGEDEQPLRPQQQFELSDHPQMVKHRRWFVTGLVQFLSALWLAPIVYLLYLNLSGHIIGASAWCPGGNCFIDAYNDKISVPQQNLVKFNKQDHNLLGGLQLVAKGLEIWFIAVCAAFVYLMIMHYASKPEGLPIGYLTRPTEFAEFINLFDPLLWTTGPSAFAKDPREKRVGRRALFIVILSVFLCLLCNLMGPATAVLAIPSLSWISGNQVGNLRFLGTNAGAPPSVGSSFAVYQATYCTSDQLTSRDYSCALDTVGSAMDAWLEQFLSGFSYQTYTSAWGLSYYVNSTVQYPNAKSKEDKLGKDNVWWVPSRQMLVNLTVDKLVMNDLAKDKTFEEIRAKFPTSDPLETYADYNRSVALQIQRTGPVTGFLTGWWYGYETSDYYGLPWTVDVDQNRQIRCYAGYCRDDDCFTKCIRIGSGWSKLNKYANFYVPKAYDAASSTSKQAQANSLGVVVNIYSSDRVLFLPNGTEPSWLPPRCLKAGNVTRGGECDWEKLFTTEIPVQMKDRAENMNTIEMYVGNGDDKESILVHDFTAFNDFATYTLDPSPLTNPMGLVRLDGLPTDFISDSKPIHVDPDWILAGWAVESNGYIQLGRPSGMLLLKVMKSFYNDGYDATMKLVSDWTNNNLPWVVGFVPIAHSLSLVDHNTGLITSQAQTDQDHPWLYRTARMYVWGYFMASRTATLGVVVTSAGCIVVLAQLYLGFKDKRRYRSPTQLLVAAMEHMPQGEFEGKRHDEKAMARVPFHVSECDRKVIRFSSLSGQGGVTPVSPNSTRVFSGAPRHSRLSSGATLFSPTMNVFSPGRKVGSPPSTGLPSGDSYFPIAPDSLQPVAADYPPIPPAGTMPVTNLSYPGGLGVNSGAAPPSSSGAASAPGSFSRVPIGARSTSVSSGSTRRHAGRSPSTSSANAPSVPPIPGFTPFQGDAAPEFQVHPTYSRTFI